MIVFVRFSTIEDPAPTFAQPLTKHVALTVLIKSREPLKFRSWTAIIPEWWHHQFGKIASLLVRPSFGYLAPASSESRQQEESNHGERSCLLGRRQTREKAAVAQLRQARASSAVV